MKKKYYTDEELRKIRGACWAVNETGEPPEWRNYLALVSPSTVAEITDELLNYRTVERMEDEGDI